MDWRQFVMDLEALNPDSVEEIFARHGACSVTFSGTGTDPVLEPAPGETPLWRQTRVTGLFAPDVDLDGLRDDLRRAFATDKLPSYRIDAIEDRSWELEWARDLVPMRFGRRLWVCPGDTTAPDTDAVIVRLDPGLAFGTGTHATTAMCLDWLEGLSIEGTTMLDYGCGSGVLAIAALKLGCGSASALDIDPQAARATAANAARNDVASRLRVTLRAQDLDHSYDVVVANILAGPLTGLAQSIATRVGVGCLLALSGILSDQVDDVHEAYRPWIDFDEPRFSDQGGQTWAQLSGRRIES
jgi:ribosomal protein L11 methyltransferase